MTEREKDLNSQKNNDSRARASWRREQLQLLTELAETAAGTAGSMSRSAYCSSGEQQLQNPITCDCGPVLIDPEKISAPAVGLVSDTVLRNPTTKIATASINDGDSDDLTHPLWEKRYLCNATRTQTISFFVHPFFRKAVAVPPSPPKPCRGGILADSMGLGKTVMLLSLIEASKEDDEKKGETQNRSTLVVTPLSLLLQWENEIESKTCLSRHVHYGDSKKQSHGGQFDDADVVLTTYGSLQAEYSEFLRNRDSNGQTSAIFSKRWKRIILDECHSIKTPTTIAAKACCYLEAERRWCVSGTIIQNSLEDVYSLLKFLRHEPWCEYSFWKEAVRNVSDPSIALDRVKRVLGPIMIRRTKETLGSDGKPILTLPDVDFKTVVVEFTPAERQFYEALYRKSFDIFNGFIQTGTASSSWLKIFSLLQRLRQTCSHVALTVKSHMEDNAWNASVLESKGQESPRKLRAGTPASPTTHNTDTIDHSFLEELHSIFKSMQESNVGANSNGDGPEDSSSRQYTSEIANMLNSAVLSGTSDLDQECSICLENMTVDKSVITPCLHIFCKDCLMDVLKSPANGEVWKNKVSKHCPYSGNCPVCYETVDVQKILRLSRKSDGKYEANYLNQKPQTSEEPSSSSNGGDNGASQVLRTAMKGAGSSKLSAIHQELDKIWKEEPGSKVLVFSQFLGFLDIMETSFKTNKISYSRLDGKLNLKERMAVLRDFGSSSSNHANSTGKPTGSVLLISMKAGGVVRDSLN
jgi:DNA repair protein RAD5